MDHFQAMKDHSIALNSSSSPSSSSAELEDLTKTVLKAKLKLALLKREKRMLIEELHRQCLEGEIDPKKRIKPFLDRRKKIAKLSSI